MYLCLNIVMILVSNESFLSLSIIFQGVQLSHELGTKWVGLPRGGALRREPHVDSDSEVL